MTRPTLDPHTPLSAAVVAAVGERITGFLRSQDPVLAGVAAWVPDSSSTVGEGAQDLGIVQRLAATVTAGGKRLRPAFVIWGHVAAAGVDSVTDPVWTAAAALDLLHVSALVHDDVMDGSDLRRGAPAAHRQFESRHSEGRPGEGQPGEGQPGEGRWTGDAEQFGRAGAILLGDLLLMWSAEMIDTAGLDPAALARGLPVLHAMRTEVTLGQFLDVIAQVQPPGAGEAAAELARAARVVEHKSARYTVQRPLQFGASLAGASPELLDSLARYGSVIGRAFQYRDDVLGVFGDEAVTGKPAGDDLREGKRTVLVAHTRGNLDRSSLARFDELFGRGRLIDAERDELRELITGSGARVEVETMINSLHDEAVVIIEHAPMTADGRTALAALAEASVRREA